MIVRPWQKGDPEKINIQSAQRYVADIGMLSADLTPLVEHNLAWSMVRNDEVVACWGIMPAWGNRGVAFALLSGSIGSLMASVHKNAERLLNDAPFRRIEAHVDVGFDQGVRWMKLLGFELEAYKRAFRPDGADMLEFVRIK